jgi:hypothetical protein
MERLRRLGVIQQQKKTAPEGAASQESVVVD